MKKFQNILVAFDLNKTLFYKCESPLPRMHDRKMKRLYFYFRPHLQELIEYLHTNQINYCFWSNMLGRNCIKYVKQLESLGMKNYCGIFDQDFCDKEQNLPEIGQRVKSIKNLHKLAHAFQINVDNCILVDDSKQKNVEGCNLIHVNPFEGQQVDKQILHIIQKIKQFRKTKVNQQQSLFPLLKYTQYLHKPEIMIKASQSKPQKSNHPTEIQIQMQNDPQLKRLKTDLTSQKQNRKILISEMQNLQKSNAQMANQIKKQSEGKVVRKGDQLLVQVLMFAKNKKAAEKKLEQLQKKKNLSDQKITLIKKLMRVIMQKLNLKDNQGEQKQTKHETPSQYCSDVKKIQSKKQKKSGRTLQNQFAQMSINESAEVKEAKREEKIQKC